ncbi:Metal-dependent hydrolase, endonuclease/exonuclease/phosphatase family [Amycolatopsis arida]|uniref:Metal-dependent hydrolase, endonuclease/exonuclease/phosphatase family n=1 Tax=Amycolatopsis arida TaxID=587909 RepID=A0A1I5MJX6_9PSEU|nr:jacalin-like lectin [Amycolatopsis arida]TDX94122.1 endonuclease/exonuclease/phosphatase family metal-dependent hydrolase [Amycolatopsis arida]SFP09904.1 Metal-dependent hydrolase, endonuclease/exonuclease/phosphatase family [Amycolatopsis arida]
MRIGTLRAAAVLAVASPAGPVDSAAAEPAATGGQFSVLTYNIAGLPELLSGSDPERNTPVIGEHINAYDVVHVQEDFNYHAALYRTNRHPHRTPTSGGAGLGDGLNTLSHHPYADFARVRWNACNGTDCLTPKGFSFSRIRLAEGAYVDFYNLHPNAGVSPADLAARRSNISQLSAFIATYSAGNAVVVMGDTNTRYTRAEDNIRELVVANGLTDAWVQLEREGRAPAAGSPALVCDPDNVTDVCEVVDKILYRGNRYVRLTATDYRNEHGRFLDAEGKPLSDHYPIAATLRWSLDESLRLTDQVGGPHGVPFTDVDRVPVPARVSRVAIRSGERVDAVSTTLADGTVFAHGGSGGTERALTLSPGEYLTEITLDTGQKDGRTRIFHVRFRTNLGRVLSGGTPTSSTGTHTAPPGWQIVAFHGRAGAELDKLGVIQTRVNQWYAPFPRVPQS